MPHDMLRIDLDFIALDTWDGETGQVLLDGAEKPLCLIQAIPTAEPAVPPNGLPALHPAVQPAQEARQSQLVS